MQNISSQLSFISLDTLYFSLSAIGVSTVVCKVQEISQRVLQKKYITEKSSLKNRVIVDLTSYFAGLCAGIVTGGILQISKFSSFQISMITLAAIYFSNGAITNFFRKIATARNLLSWLSLLLLARKISFGKKPPPNPTPNKGQKGHKNNESRVVNSKIITEETDSTESKIVKLSADKIGDTIKKLIKAKEEGENLKTKFIPNSTDWIAINKTVEELEKLIKGLEKENQTLKDDNQKIDDLLNEISQLKQENLDRKNENSSQKKQIDTLEQEKLTVQEENEQLKKKVKKKKEKISSLKKKNQKQETKINDLDKQVKKLKKEKTDTEKKYKKKIEKLETKVEKLIEEKKNEGTTAQDAMLYLGTILSTLKNLKSGAVLFK